MAKLTIEQVMEAVESGDSVGFCLACGAQAECVEPDAEKYECESCGKPKVYGAEQILIMFA